MRDLPKSKTKYSREAFSKLFCLAEKHPWLKQYDRSESIEHLEKLITDEAQTDLIVDLLEAFDFNTSTELTAFIYSSVKHISETIELDPKTVAFVAKKKKTDNSLDSSWIILGFLQNIFPAESGLSKKNIFVSARDALAKKNIENIILIDDFSGTGNSLNDYIIWLKDECDALSKAHVSVHAFFFKALKDTSIRKYDSLLKTLEIGKVLPKGISEYYTPDSKVKEQIQRMLQIEEAHGNVGNYSLGFGKSESLYSCEGISTPNNVFPIFWKRRSTKLPFHRPLLNRK